MPTKSLHILVIAQYIRADSGLVWPVHSHGIETEMSERHSFIHKKTDAKIVIKPLGDVAQDVTDINAQVEI